jgi:phosphoribosyl 1,2-cyclic phosphodiesterase
VRPGRRRINRLHLHFLGTRGEIEVRTRQHRMHTTLLVWHRTGRVMIDCGLDWRRRVRRLRPDAIVLTHAHPDHAWGLKDGAPCPVFAPEQTWQTLQGCRVDDCRVLPLRKPERICGVTFEAFAVEHSLLAPAVGYRVSAGRACFFYVPDVVFIHERAAALKGGAAVHR